MSLWRAWCRGPLLQSTIATLVVLDAYLVAAVITRTGHP